MAKKQEMDNLTICSNAALEAGMSYGKYMALQYKNGRELVAKVEEKPKDDHRTKCEWCGGEIYAKRRGLKYCSPECSYDARRARERASTKPPEPKVCEWCGNTFVPTRNSPKIKYCTRQCGAKANSYRIYWERRGQNGERISCETGADPESVL